LNKVAEDLSVLLDCYSRDPSSKSYSLYFQTWFFSLGTESESKAKLRCRFLGGFGAILIILSLAFHTLIQNAISTKSGLLEVNTQNTNLTATYPQGNNYSLALQYSTGNTLGDQGPALDMVADINYGMFYYISDPDTQIQLTIASCYFGNCTWEHIQTLSVCSQCADVTSDIGQADGYYTLYGENVTMSQDTGLITSLGSTFYPDPTVLQDIGPLIVHFTAIVRETTEDQPMGIDCALFWCIKDSTNVIMTRYEITNSIDTYWTDISPAVQTTYQQTEDVILTPLTCYNQYAEEVPDVTKCTKTVASFAQLGLQNFFVSAFTGMATKNLTTQGWNINSEFVQILYSTIQNSDDILATYRAIMGDIGHMIQDNIQQQLQGGYASTFGTMYNWTTLFNIRWGYLIAAAALIGVTILFLLVTIFQNRKQEKWKSSLLPLLFHPLAARPGIPLHEIPDMKVEAKAIEVRLERGHLGSQFV
jgi:hypothetical protein